MLPSCNTYRALSTVRVSKVKYVVWSGDMSHVALMGRNGESGLVPVHTLSLSSDLRAVLA